MPTLCVFRGIRITMYWDDHFPPHFHATYAGEEVTILIESLDVYEGSIPSKQLKMVLGWAALHQEELRENWMLSQKQEELYNIEPLR